MGSVPGKQDPNPSSIEAISELLCCTETQGRNNQPFATATKR